jgi:hypothetical protein
VRSSSLDSYFYVSPGGQQSYQAAKRLRAVRIAAAAGGGGPRCYRLCSPLPRSPAYFLGRMVWMDDYYDGYYYRLHSPTHSLSHSLSHSLTYSLSTNSLPQCLGPTTETQIPEIPDCHSMPTACGAGARGFAVATRLR